MNDQKPKMTFSVDARRVDDHGSLAQCKSAEITLDTDLQGRGRRARVPGAGLPVDVPALTVNRVWGSGTRTVVSAAQEIWSAMAECTVAGGMENVDRAPYLLPLGCQHGRCHPVRPQCCWTA